jgi:molybdopterin-synthase adenylyltransferase
MENMNKKQLERYARQMVLPGFGKTGQKRLLNGKVLVIGAGGLGSPAGFYLAAAGVGTIGLVDFQKVSLSNLQRQIAHTTRGVGRAKVKSAAAAFKALNPDVRIREHKARFTAKNARTILADYDFVLDCTDNLESKFLIADACHFARIPYSHAGVAGYQGQTMTVIPGQTACYRCVFTAPPAKGSIPSPVQTGVLGPVPAVIGSIQAAEAIKFLLGAKGRLTNRLLVFDSLGMQFRTVQLRRNRKCPLCGDKTTKRR